MLSTEPSVHLPLLLGNLRLNHCDPIMLLRQLRGRLLSDQLLRQGSSVWQSSRKLSTDQDSHISITTPEDAASLSTADEVLSLSETAEAAAVAAAQADCWLGTRKLMDVLTTTHEGLGLEW